MNTYHLYLCPCPPEVKQDFYVYLVVRKDYNICCLPFAQIPEQYLPLGTRYTITPDQFPEIGLDAGRLSRDIESMGFHFVAVRKEEHPFRLWAGF